MDLMARMVNQGDQVRWENPELQEKMVMMAHVDSLDRREIPAHQENQAVKDIQDKR